MEAGDTSEDLPPIVETDNNDDHLKLHQPVVAVPERKVSSLASPDSMRSSTSSTGSRQWRSSQKGFWGDRRRFVSRVNSLNSVLKSPDTPSQGFGLYVRRDNDLLITGQPLTAEEEEEVDDDAGFTALEEVSDDEELRDSIYDSISRLSRSLDEPNTARESEKSLASESEPDTDALKLEPMDAIDSSDASEFNPDAATGWHVKSFGDLLDRDDPVDSESALERGITGVELDEFGNETFGAEPVVALHIGAHYYFAYIASLFVGAQAWRMHSGNIFFSSMSADVYVFLMCLCCVAEALHPTGIGLIYLMLLLDQIDRHSLVMRKTNDLEGAW